MNDNTPIFDRLVGERGYDPKFPPHLTKMPVLRAEDREEVRGYMAPGAWIAKAVPRMSNDEREQLHKELGMDSILPRRKAMIEEIVDPEEAEEEYGSFAGFVSCMASKFEEKYPDGTGLVAQTQEDIATGKQRVSITGWVPVQPAPWLPSEMWRMDNPMAPSTIEKATLKFFADSKGDEQLVARKKGIRLQKPVEEAPDYSASDFVRDAAVQFYKDHPEAVITHVEPRKDGEDAFILHITAEEPVRTSGEEFFIRGESSMPPVFRTEHKVMQFPERLTPEQFQAQKKLYEALSGPARFLSGVNEYKVDPSTVRTGIEENADGE